MSGSNIFVHTRGLSNFIYFGAFTDFLIRGGKMPDEKSDTWQKKTSPLETGYQWHQREQPLPCFCVNSVPKNIGPNLKIGILISMFRTNTNFENRKPHRLAQENKKIEGNISICRRDILILNLSRQLFTN